MSIIKTITTSGIWHQDLKCFIDLLQAEYNECSEKGYTNLEISIEYDYYQCRIIVYGNKHEEKDDQNDQRDG